MWICWFFHKWSKWSDTFKSNDNTPWQVRKCLRCGKVECEPAF